MAAACSAVTALPEVEGWYVDGTTLRLYSPLTKKKSLSRTIGPESDSPYICVVCSESFVRSATPDPAVVP